MKITSNDDAFRVYPDQPGLRSSSTVFFYSSANWSETLEQLGIKYGDPKHENRWHFVSRKVQL